MESFSFSPSFSPSFFRLPFTIHLQALPRLPCPPGSSLIPRHESLSTLLPPVSCLTMHTLRLGWGYMYVGLTLIFHLAKQKHLPPKLMKFVMIFAHDNAGKYYLFSEEKARLAHMYARWVSPIGHPYTLDIFIFWTLDITLPGHTWPILQINGWKEDARLTR